MHLPDKKGFTPIKSGFTLVELLVVISIIAILSVIGITIFTSAQKAARDGKRRADLDSIRKALEQYHLVSGSYPTIGQSWTTSTAAQPWIAGLDSSYMQSIPKDPINTGGCPCNSSNNGHYEYGYWAAAYGATDGTWFMLVALLENPSSSDLKTKCITPDGTTFGSSNSGATNIYPNTFLVCNQQ